MAASSATVTAATAVTAAATAGRNARHAMTAGWRVPRMVAAAVEWIRSAARWSDSITRSPAAAVVDAIRVVVADAEADARPVVAVAIAVTARLHRAGGECRDARCDHEGIPEAWMS
jgi:hypothetical protein